ncbi:MAG: hypothetical protein IPM51_03250 [Sphingobacteriaceae bacterium]|nr:hypothetical protein [Sphingobacteriaceae bacterium]
MKKSIQLILLVCGLATLILNGCKKKETIDVDNETQSALDNAIADQEFAGIVPTTNNHAINTKGTGAQNGKMAAPCDTLSKISGDTLFGTIGHVDPVFELNLGGACGQSFTDGKIRSGKWQIRLTNKIKIAGAKMIIKLINHKASGITYSCDSIVVTTLSFTPNFVKFNYKLINGQCQGPGWTIKYSSDRTITHYPKGNPGGTDPYTELFGTSDGTNRQGRTFTVNIPEATPLVKYKSCQYIQRGILTLTPAEFKERSIDFGYSVGSNPAGGCDDDASFTVNGNTIAFKLK